MSEVRGACQCGKVGFCYEAPSLWCAHCHCGKCRKAHGAAFVTWVGVEQAKVTLLDEGCLAWYASSPEAQRGFCRACGTPLFFRSSKWPGELHVTRASIEGFVGINGLTDFTCYAAKIFALVLSCIRTHFSSKY